MFENLSERLERSFKILKGEGKITEINVAETLKDVRRALLDADVNYKVAKSFTDTVKEKALGMNVLTAVKPSQLMVKLVHDELATLMGGESVDINVKGSPAVILMSGLQGSGKTTFSGKLANLLKTKRNKSVLLVAGDVYRPAAIKQLQVVGEQIGVDVYTEEDNKNPVQIAQNAIKQAKANGIDVVIVDTAGRLAVDEAMMTEIKAIKDAINPQEILFVVDSMTGQDAVNTAKEFNDRLDFSGVILTKLDGDTRGGAALSIRSVVNKPIKFVGTGEKMDALDVFHPARMADRILGMGDIVSLVERAQEQYDEEEAKRLQKKISKNQFDFNDFIAQIQQIKKMGNLKELASMIPGVGKAIKDIDIDDNAFKSIEAIIYSMTPEERTRPEILNGSRRARIAKGSGTSIQEVNRLIKQFDESHAVVLCHHHGEGAQAVFQRRHSLLHVVLSVHAQLRRAAAAGDDDGTERPCLDQGRRLDHGVGRSRTETSGVASRSVHQTGDLRLRLREVAAASLVHISAGFFGAVDHIFHIALLDARIPYGIQQSQHAGSLLAEVLMHDFRTQVHVNVMGLLHAAHQHVVHVQAFCTLILHQRFYFRQVVTFLDPGQNALVDDRVLGQLILRFCHEIPVQLHHFEHIAGLNHQNEFVLRHDLSVLPVTVCVLLLMLVPRHFHIFQLLHGGVADVYLVRPVLHRIFVASQMLRQILQIFTFRVDDPLGGLCRSVMQHHIRGVNQYIAGAFDHAVHFRYLPLSQY